MWNLLLFHFSSIDSKENGLFLMMLLGLFESSRKPFTANSLV